MSFYKKCRAKPYSFSVIDCTPASDSPFYFRKNLLKRKKKLIMSIDNKVRNKIHNKITEKPQKYRHYHQVKLINMNILQVKKSDRRGEVY